MRAREAEICFAFRHCACEMKNQFALWSFGRSPVF
jgi:hypothetical protein